MANFFTDNDDILFLFGHMGLERVAAIMEDDFEFAREFDFAPENVDDAIDNYRRILEVLGELAGDVIAPTAAETDRIGNKLNEDGTVTYAPGIAEALRRLARADLMGFTLPYKYGGLNCPQLLYTMSNDIISRADASLVNFYGLQGIADTINAFAADDIKDRYLPDLAAGRTTSAMVLTEPDAGSDLQSIKVRAYQNDQNEWFVHGVKRFITNGCGDVLLVLARSEPATRDGRGLSLFLVERGPRVKIRRLEDKLGIHGSPTCELFFDDAPAKLIGERRRGLTAYVASLMKSARIGIAAQSLGIAEAAYRVARDYARKRERLGTTVERIPQVRELLVDMSVDLQAARALTYYASFSTDLECGTSRKLQRGKLDPGEKKQLEERSKRSKKRNDMLVPMCKYFASEMSMRVANNAVTVLGGSGYMREYAVERHLRDSRITTIYEGTTQIQIAAAVQPVLGGAASDVIDELIGREWPAEVAPLADRVREGLDMLDESIAFVERQSDSDYTNLYARRVVDMACALIIGGLFCGQAAASESKAVVTRRWMDAKLPELRAQRDLICSGNRTVLEEFDALAGRAPTVD